MSVHLLNGNKTERVRSSEGCTVLDCGCAATATEWVQMCEPHFAEWDARRRAALEDHAREAARGEGSL